MRLDFVGVDPENPDDQCPAVFRDPGTGDFYMQGETVTSPGILAWINPDSRILDTESLGNPCRPRPLPPAQQARQALADQLREIRLAARADCSDLQLTGEQNAAAAGPRPRRVTSDGPRGLQADAQRNRERIVGAARELFMAEDDPWVALCRYLREWSALRLGVLYDALCDHLPAMLDSDPELREARLKWPSTLDEMVAAAQASGHLRPDVRAGDIALVMNLLQQRKPGHALLEQNSARFLELMLDGLSTHRAVPLPGEPLTISALDRSAGTCSRCAGQ